MRKSFPSWIKPAMGWLDSRGYSRHSENDYRSFFDHTIVVDDMIVSFPYGFDKTKMECFKSFCKLYGHVAHFYESPSIYHENASTIAIYPKQYDDQVNAFDHDLWINIMKNRIIKVLDKRYPSSKHTFTIGKEILTAPTISV